MGLLDRPQQAQRYGLLSPDVMQLIQSGGPRMAPAPAPAPAQRQRVSGWRVLDRVLGGETVSAGLDAERARLQAEAERPQAQARMQAMRLAAERMGPEAMIAFNTNPEAFGESLGMQFRPVTTAAGSRTTYGPRAGAFTVEQPTFDVMGDQAVRRDSTGVAPVYTRTAPSIKEGIDRSVAETGRINALNVPVAPNTDLVDPTTGRKIYEGYRAPEIVNVAPGGEALVFDGTTPVGRVGSTQVRPMSDADQAAVARAENTLAQNRVARSRAAQFRQQIAGGDLNLGPVTNSISGLRNMAGQSNPNSLNYDALMNWAKEARDTILAANTGVQTDGDAVRALERIISTPNDERVVAAALQRFEESQAATAQVFERDIQRRSAAPVPAGGNEPAPAAPGRATHRNAQGQGIYWNGSAWVPGQ
jgi:hypothetical protein